MRRRIPKSRRHKKLKFVDPCYRGPAPRSKKKKALPNEPPIDEDEQEMPFNMQQLINEKNQAKQMNVKMKKRKKNKNKIKDDFIIVKTNKMKDDKRGMTKPVKPLPKRVMQGKNESQYKFMNRLQQMTDMAIAEAQVEQKYDISLVHIDKDGNAKYVAGGDEEVGKMKREKRKRYEQRKKEKKLKKKEVDETLNFPKDAVKFGEVVLQPPSLHVKPKKVAETVKAGKRKLILNELFNKETTEPPKKIKVTTGKRKDLTAGQRRILEEERQRVVDLYRALKDKNKKITF